MSLISGKRSIQKCIHNLNSQSRTYHTSSKCKDVGIIVKSCCLCGKAVCTYSGTNSLDLVGCNGNADSGSAYQNSKITLAIQNAVCNLLGINRVIRRLGAVAAIVLVRNLCFL